MSNSFSQQGQFSWFELMTTDPAAAQTFYSQLFGWSMRDEQMPDMTYTIAKAGDKDVGGIMPMTEMVAPGTPPQWGVYVTVDDVDATSAQAQDLGATILLPPRDIPGVGRFAVIQDPQGAVLSIITYGGQG